jgi:hypothetical protein
VTDQVGPDPRAGLEAKRLVCPYCGADIEANLEYTGHGYSEHRDLTGYECESYACDAHWDRCGNVTQPSKLARPSSEVPAPVGLLPAEWMAVTMARAQVRRRSSVPPRTVAVLLGAVERLAGGDRGVLS